MSLDALGAFFLGGAAPTSSTARRARSARRSPTTPTDLFVAPGDTVAPAEARLLQGRGVGLDASGNLVATLAGRVRRVNKLLFIEPAFSPFLELAVGDVVVGRVCRVEGTRWQIDLGGARPAFLNLSSVNLPDGAQRRRTAEDSLQIRDVFKENDLILAEVQRAEPTGDIQLQARSARYGKLVGGRLLKIPAALLRKAPQSIHVLTRDVRLPDEKTERPRVQLVLGRNGWVFAGEAPRLAGSGIHTVNFSQFLPAEESRQRSVAVRKLVSAYVDAVSKLAKAGRMVDVTSVETSVDSVELGGGAGGGGA